MLILPRPHDMMGTQVTTAKLAAIRYHNHGAVHREIIVMYPNIVIWLQDTIIIIFNRITDDDECCKCLCPVILFSARHPAPLHHLARHKQAAGGSFDVDRGPFYVDRHQPEESCIGLSLQTCTLNLV